MPHSRGGLCGCSVSLSYLNQFPEQASLDPRLGMIDTNKWAFLHIFHSRSVFKNGALIDPHTIHAHSKLSRTRRISVCASACFNSCHWCPTIEKLEADATQSAKGYYNADKNPLGVLSSLLYPLRNPSGRAEGGWMSMTALKWRSRTLRCLRCVSPNFCVAKSPVT